MPNPTGSRKPPRSPRAAPRPVFVPAAGETQIIPSGIADHPETVMPTAPAPTHAEAKRGRFARRPRGRPPRTAQLTTPAPPVQLLEEKVRELVALQGEHPGQDLIADMMMTALRMVRDGSERGELKILAASMRELRYGFHTFREYRHRRKITVFGSARTPPDAPEYKQAWTFAEKMVKRKFMVITGGGAGIMEAAQGGAGRENSFGVNIKLPFEQAANKFIKGDRKLLQFRYFFTRKLCFVKEASAIALFPGGFGTHDECYETLTLVQTGKAAIIPIVFIDKPGGTYWREWADYVVEHLLGQGMICEDDMQLFKITDDAEWAANEVSSFYTRYHSSRFVKDTLVIRLLSRLPRGSLERLNDEFGSLLARGKIEETEALPDEAGEPELLGLPRIAFAFNRRSFGTLRRLIDEINRA